MEIISKEEFLEQKEEYMQKIIDGAVFIYPTDTIYGIGCNANLDSAVSKIREIKQREENPFSIIAPSLDWLKENCAINENANEWLEKLPGPYTFIFKIKNQSFSKQVNPNTNAVGIRMPNNWFTEIASEMNIPIVSTSANISGEPHMVSVQEGNQEIMNAVDFVIDEGTKKGKPSTIMDLTNENVIKEIKR